jgi:hypothetical protein
MADDEDVKDGARLEEDGGALSPPLPLLQAATHTATLKIAANGPDLICIVDSPMGRRSPDTLRRARRR